MIARTKQFLAHKYFGFCFIYTIDKNQNCPSKILFHKLSLEVLSCYPSCLTTFMVLERKSKASEVHFLGDAVAMQIWTGDYEAL